MLIHNLLFSQIHCDIGSDIIFDRNMDNAIVYVEASCYCPCLRPIAYFQLVHHDLLNNLHVISDRHDNHQRVRSGGRGVERQIVWEGMAEMKPWGLMAWTGTESLRKRCRLSVHSGICCICNLLRSSAGRELVEDLQVSRNCGRTDPRHLRL